MIFINGRGVNPLVTIAAIAVIIFIGILFLTSAMRLPSVPRTVHRTAGRWLFARV